MTNLNPDQKLHSIEGINPAIEAEDDIELKGGEVSPELNLEDLPDLNETPEEVIEVVGESNEGVEEGVEEIELPALDDIENEYPFQIDSETGLSSQLTDINSLEAQLQALEEGSSGYEEIKSGIENDRSQEKIEFETSLEEEKRKLRGIYTTLYTKGKGAGSFTGNAEQMVIINNYLGKLKSNSSYLAQAMQIEDTISSIKSNIDTLTTQLSAFNTETQSQIAEAIKVTKDTLQTELSQAQQEYTGTEAEAFDTKILLERQLEGQLTDPNNLFSQDNINQIFATYGLKEGRDRLQQLREESTQAREQVARNEIREDIFSYAYDYRNNPDLAQALSIDIQTKLESLPPSEGITRALSLNGTDKLTYLTESKDSQLNALAFWFDRDTDIDQVLSEHPQFAQYVKSKTDEGYRQQQQKITEGILGGRTYLNSEADNQLQQGIDSRIESQFNTAKTDEIDKLKSEISGLEYAEDYYSSDRQDKLMLAEKDALRPSDVSQFNGELEKALESGQITFEKGDFNSVENIPAKNTEINSQLGSLSNETKSLIKNSDQISPELRQRLQSLEIEQQRKAIQSEIDSISSRRRFKWFGIGKKKAESLTSLQNQVNASLIRQNALKTQFTQNQEQYQKILANISRLKELYDKLPKSIQSRLNSLENPNFDSMNTTIDNEVQELQNYETPAELKAQRDKIAELKEQIKNLEEIK
jgi:hypothetical protein